MNLESKITLICEEWKTLNLPDNSIDAVVTDPPYGLRFMGKKWDYDIPSVEQLIRRTCAVHRIDSILGEHE